MNNCKVRLKIMINYSIGYYCTIETNRNVLVQKYNSPIYSTRYSSLSKSDRLQGLGIYFDHLLLVHGNGEL